MRTEHDKGNHMALDLGTLVDAERGYLDRSVFTDPSLYELELARIFCRCWLFIVHEDQLRAPGDYFSTFMGADPVVAVRRSDETIGVYLNSCRHRGMKLCRADAGTARALTCSYHGWTYDLDGALVSAPNLADGYFDGLDLAANSLIAARVESYNGLVFATWDHEAPSLVDYLGDMAFYLDGLLARGTGGGTEVLGLQKWSFKGNWKQAAEQFASDMQHAPIAHASAIQAMLPPLTPEELAVAFAPLDGLQFSDGHGHGFGFHLDVTEEAERAFTGPEVAGYIARDVGPRVSEQQRRGPAFNGHGNVFPNLGFLPTYGTLRQWHPKGPDEFEIWSWLIVDRSAPADVKDAWRKLLTRTFSPSGMLEQDDGEVWSDCYATHQGFVARQVPLNYQMGVGHVRSGEGGFPGELTYVMSDNAARGFYRRWQELLSDDVWKLPSLEPGSRGQFVAVGGRHG